MAVVLAAVVAAVVVTAVFPPAGQGPTPSEEAAVVLTPSANPHEWSALPGALLWALVTIGVTLLLGRVFCG